MITGWPPGLLQDDERKLSRWFASRPDARYQLRKHMTTQPTALWLATKFDRLKIDVIGPENALAMEDAAAELRRLHEELQATERQVEILSDELSKCSKINAELRLALSRIGGRCDVEPAYKIARAAIAKSTGEQK